MRSLETQLKLCSIIIAQFFILEAGISQNIPSNLLWEKGLIIKNAKIVVNYREEVFLPSFKNNQYIVYTNKRGKMVVDKITAGRQTKYAKIELSNMDMENYRNNKIHLLTMQDSNCLTVVLWNKTIDVFYLVGGYFKKTFTVRIEHNPESVIVKGQYIYLCFCYYFHPRDSKKSTWIDKVNFDGKIVSSIDLINKNPEYTIYKPSSCFDFDDNYIYYCELSRPVIWRINYNFEDKDSMLFIENNWKTVDSTFHNRIAKYFHSKYFKEIKRMDSVILETVDRNFWISTNANSQNILIMTSGHIGKNACKQNNFFTTIHYNSNFDILEKDTLSETNCNFDSRMILNRTNMPFWSSSGIIKICENRIYQIHFSSPIFPLGITYLDYFKRKEKYLSRKKPVISVWIYSIEE